MNDPIFSLEAPVMGGRDYVLDLCIEARDTAKGPPALVAFRFRDAEGMVVDPAPGDFAPSAIFGTYRYIGKPEARGRIPARLAFQAPEGAVALRAELHRWRAEDLHLVQALQLAPAPGAGQSAAQAAFVETRLLAQYRGPVQPGEAHVITLDLQGTEPLTPRSALVAVQFTDPAGEPVIAAGMPLSAHVGPFLYLSLPENPGQTAPAHARIIAPATAQAIQLQVLRWSKDMDLAAGAVAVTCRANGPELIARGEAKVQPGQWLRLRAAQADLPPGPLHADLVFFDATGAPLPGAPGPEGEDLLLEPVPGQAALQAAIPVPEAAQSLRWRLYGATAAAHGGADAVKLDMLPADIAPAEAVARLTPNQRNARLTDVTTARLLRNLPRGPIWQQVARGGLCLLSAAMLPVQPGQWLRSEGRVRRGPGRQGTALWLHPVCLDAEMQPIAALPVGCLAVPRLGAGCPVRLLRDHDGSELWGETVQMPPDARFAAVFLLGEGEAGPDLVGARPLARPVQEAELARDLIPDARLSGFGADRQRLWLQAALKVAEALRDLPARHALQAALACHEAKPAGHSHQARALGRVLADLGPDWLPRIAPWPGKAGRDAPVLWLAGSAPVAESWPLGSGHAVCLDLNAAGPQMAAPAGVDGLHRLGHDGAEWFLPQYPGLAPGRLAPADVVQMEAGFAARAARQIGAGLIHAGPGRHGHDGALKGLAVARAGGVPFVLDRSLLPVGHVPDGQDSDSLFRLRRDQMLRCLVAADAVAVASVAMRAALLAQDGVAAEKLFVLPACLPADLAEVAPDRGFARTRLGLAEGAVLLGVDCGANDPAALRLALAAAARLRAEGRALHLLLHGAPSPEAGSMIADHGLSGHVAWLTPAAQAANRAGWAAGPDLMLVLRSPDPTNDLIEPGAALTAMAMATPLLLSDRPFAAALTGTGTGVQPCPETEPQALASRIATSLDQDAQARTAQARAWVRAERGPAARVAGYAALHAHARLAHAARHKEKS